MGLRAGIVVAGAVGKIIYQCIREYGLPCDEVRVLATRERDEDWDGEPVRVLGLGNEFSEENLPLFEGLDVVFFAGREGEKGAAKQWAMRVISEYGPYCIDNGSDFRMDPAIPLVVPEVNLDDVTADTRFIASPNCSTIQMCVALAPLHRAARIKRIVATTFQSVSGWGEAAQKELCKQLCACDTNRLGKQEIEFDSGIFRKPIVLDCLPHIDAFMSNGYTKEELKMHCETQRIFGDPGIQLTATCVRVPVEVGHSEALTVEFEGPMSAEQAFRLWDASKATNGVVVMDQSAKDTPGWPAPNPPSAGSYGGATYADERSYPTQADIRRDDLKNLTLVGRVRDDYTQPNTINFWCVADNLRKGAATNVVQIAVGLRAKGLL